MGNTPSSSATAAEKKSQDKEEDEQPPLPPQQQEQSQYNQTVQPEYFTCEICIEPLPLPNKLFKNGNKCAHLFCTECVVKYIQAKLDENIVKIPCLALDCSQFLNPLTFRGIVGPELFVRWCDALCETALMGFPRSYCPNRNCSALIVNECGGNVKKAVCPNCKRPFCFQCKVPWHAGFRCEESREPRDRNDRAFCVLAEWMRWMRCPECHHFVELIDGCQIIKCRCRTIFCYRCGGKVNLHGCVTFLMRCGASFCYKCGRQVHQHWCRCDSTYWCCTWCFQILLVLLFGFSIVLVFRLA